MARVPSQRLLICSAVAETATGLGLFGAPGLVGNLLLGEELTGVAVPVARVLGIALLALGIACWSGRPMLGMLTYGAIVAVYLSVVGIHGVWSGPFLWPAVALHAILTLFLTFAAFDKPSGSTR